MLFLSKAFIEFSRMLWEEEMDFKIELSKSEEERVMRLHK